MRRSPLCPSGDQRTGYFTSVLSLYSVILPPWNSLVDLISLDFGIFFQGPRLFTPLPPDFRPFLSLVILDCHTAA